MREVEEFEDLTVSAFNINVRTAPDWQSVKGAFLDLMEGFAGTLDLPDWIRSARIAIGVFDIASKMNYAASHPDFSSLRDHVALFFASKGLVQNLASPSTDAETNKIFELLFAAIAMQFASEVTVEHPHRSKGNNPDVIMTFRGRTYGVACKAPHSRNYKTIAENIKKGVEQVIASPADTGFAAINLKNVWDNEKLWSAKGGGSYTSWETAAEADFAIDTFVHEYHDQVLPELTADLGWVGRTIPIVTYYLAPTVLINTPNGPALTPLRRLFFRKITSSQLTSTDEDVVELLHRSAQRPFSGSRGIYSLPGTS